MDHIEIFIEFQDGNELQFYINALGEKQVETTTWFISENGQLVIEDVQGAPFETDSQWAYTQGLLVLQEEKDEKGQPHVFFARVE